MTPFDLEDALKSMVVIADTREQDTLQSRRRYMSIGVPVERETLRFGDYTAYCMLPNGEKFSLADKVVIERKCCLEELSGNFFQNRKRFEREFGRARDAGAKTYLLVENGSFDKIYFHDYKTKANPKSYAATAFTWLARYNCVIVFCGSVLSGQVIYEILYRELKERLENMESDADG